jgi:hypothetical protein
MGNEAAACAIRRPTVLVATDQPLLGQVHGLALVDLDLVFESSSCRKRPTCAASALIADGMGKEVLPIERHGQLAGQWESRIPYRKVWPTRWPLKAEELAVG